MITQINSMHNYMYKHKLIEDCLGKLYLKSTIKIITSAKYQNASMKAILIIASCNKQNDFITQTSKAVSQQKSFSRRS